MEADPGGHQHAAAGLGFSPLICSRTAERVIIRLLIQAGLKMHDLTVTDLRDTEAAFRDRGERRNSDWSDDRVFLHASMAVTFPVQSGEGVQVRVGGGEVPSEMAQPDRDPAHSGALAASP